jgi:hypothetical protein
MLTNQVSGKVNCKSHNLRCVQEATITELLVAIGLIAGFVAAHAIGFWLGSLTRSADDQFDRQVAGQPRALWLRFWSALHFQGQHHALSIVSTSL